MEKDKYLTFDGTKFMMDNSSSGQYIEMFCDEEGHLVFV
jgi:hypothetical protein